ncbi:MAG: hypothetical protein JXN64_06965 [Spirochaetes bacterium]|nr:hypothetical protein [Spirochaetota bacterium]
MFRHRKGWGYGKGGGPSKECICPKCKTIIPHKRGTPCFQVMCPRCNTPMMARLYFEDSPQRR